jgi:hypothetical protein
MISCDEFLKRLVEEDGGNTPARKKEYEEHLATCEDCKDVVPAYRDYAEEMEKPTEPVPEDDPVRKAVMAFAETHLAMKNAKPKPVLRPVFGRALAMAALLLVGLGLGLVGGYESRPKGSEFPGQHMGDENVERLWLAHRALDLGLVEEAHDLAKKVLAEPELEVAVRKDAEWILETK